MKIKIYTLLTVSSILIQSCCQEKCITNQMIIEFRGFEPADLASVKITSFKPNGLFNEPNQTINYTNVFHQISLSDAKLDDDWEIELPELNKIYSIKEVTTRTEDCPCEDGTYRMITGYTVDDVITNSEVIVIRK